MTFPKVVFVTALLMAGAFASPLLYKDKVADIKQSEIRVDGEYRLPNNTVPISYSIELIPYIVVGNFTFDGKVQIKLKVLQTTSTITLHTKTLTYDESFTTLVSRDDVMHEVLSHGYDTNKDFLTISFRDEIPVGNYTLNLSFVGILNEEMEGFYRSSYVNASGDTVWLATTLFAATRARRAFPCYDEPALKATFKIAIKHESHFHALSNMPIVEKYEDESDGKIWTIFGVTPIMSSYLNAFIVSDFSAIKNSDETFNVWTRPSAISSGQYAYKIGSIELAELEDFTNVTYAMPKMDQVGIPDFQAGAMENWGLVTYREALILYEDGVSTLSTKQAIATTISHEFSHQWFGNIVSPTWWKYLWLSEGFASYFEYFTTDAAENNWRLMDQFVVIEQQGKALAADDSAYSHPMNVDVESPSEILSIFDTISYAKAACVIRMLSHILTEDVFKSGLTKYLNTHAYGTATSNDLFKAMQEAENEAGMLPLHVRVKNVMDTWVNQMGYPIVTVTRNYTSQTAEISQERFLSENASPTDDHEYKWWIPINWASQMNPDFESTVAQAWISAQDKSVIINGFNDSEWIILNKQQSGYYRVNYDETNWEMIANYLNSENLLEIHASNRAALIDDASKFADVNRISYTVLLNLIRYLENEIDYIPWYAAFTNFVNLHRAYANNAQYELFRTYLALLTSKVFDTVGVEETDTDDHLTKLKRVDVINYACMFGLKKCLTSSEAKVSDWLENSTATPLSPSLLTNTICAGLRSANSTTWEKAFARFQSTELTTESNALLIGLGCSENEDIIKSWMTAIFDSATGLTAPNSYTAFSAIYQRSAYNIDRAFDFLDKNVNTIITYFNGVDEFKNFVTGIANRLTTNAQLEKLINFVEANTEILDDAIHVVINYVGTNIAWTTANEAEISTWLINTVPDMIPDDGEEVESTTPENSASTMCLSFFVTILMTISVYL